MRELLNQVKQNPSQKMDSIQNMINDLFKQSKWQEWDIQIENNPQILQSRTLAIPELEHNLGADQ